MISYLEVEGVRNLSSVKLTPSPHLNLITGANGSGKTSLLESLHILSHGRSFRSHQLRHVINHAQQHLTVFSRVTHDGKSDSVGIRRNRDGSANIRINGQNINNVSALARLLPIELFTPSSHRLVEEGPKNRRAFIDWGLFHVEPQYHQTWKRFRRGLQQRNAAIRSQQIHTLDTWDREFCISGELITAWRRKYINQIADELSVFIPQLLPDLEIELSYAKGWSGEHSLELAVAHHRHKDIEAGYTQVGPQRGDLRIRSHGQPISEVLSRGQQKMLVLALMLAQVHHLYKSNRHLCVLLIDDLAAELDSQRRRQVLNLLAETGSQTFLTATTADDIATDMWDEVRVFHVEHGEVSEVV